MTEEDLKNPEWLERHPLTAAVAHVFAADNRRIEALTARLADVEAESGRRFELIQALLNAVKGTIDTSTQIADHPNVKFVQMQRLHWEKVEAEVWQRGWDDAIRAARPKLAEVEAERDAMQRRAKAAESAWQSLVAARSEELRSRGTIDHPDECAAESAPREPVACPQCEASTDRGDGVEARCSLRAGHSGRHSTGPASDCYPPPGGLPACPQWQPIETAPKDVEAFFWIVPKTADESYCDTSGRPVVSLGEPRWQLCKYGRWSSLSKATHWMPLLQSLLQGPS